MNPNEIIPVVEFTECKSNLHFEIQNLLEIQNTHSDVYDLPHRHSYFEIIWIARGSGSFWVDLQKFDITGNQLFCVKPGQVHQLQTSETTEGFIVSFTKSFLNNDEYEFDIAGQARFFEFFTNTKVVLLKDDDTEEIDGLFIKMIKEFNNSYQFKLQVLRRYLKILMIYFTRQIEGNINPDKQSRNTELVEKFFELIEKNFKKNKMVLEYANQLYVTPNYLNEVVKKSTGYTAGHHIRQRVALEAKRLAHYSNLCMKEIAYSLDFSDSAHFSKFFKSVAGLNFTDFKKGKITLSTAV